MTKNKKILGDHKRVGKRLIPPIMQLPNLVMTSFRDDVLPDLIWLAALFRKLPDKTAVDLSIEFVKICSSVLADDRPPLVRLGNFDKLSTDDKNAVIKKIKSWSGRSLLLSTINHQMELFPDYPLKFLTIEEGRTSHDAISQLKADVTSLLDRYSHDATKVQVTAIVALATSGKLFFTQNVEIPDFDAIFLAPDSTEAKRAASFARANFNAGSGLEGSTNERWLKSFWHQAHDLEGCE